MNKVRLDGSLTKTDETTTQPNSNTQDWMLLTFTLDYSYSYNCKGKGSVWCTISSAIYKPQSWKCYLINPMRFGYIDVRYIYVRDHSWGQSRNTFRIRDLSSKFVKLHFSIVSLECVNVGTDPLLIVKGKRGGVCVLNTNHGLIFCPCQNVGLLPNCHSWFKRLKFMLSTKIWSMLPSQGHVEKCHPSPWCLCKVNLCILLKLSMDRSFEKIWYRIWDLKIKPIFIVLVQPWYQPATQMGNLLFFDFPLGYFPDLF